MNETALANPEARTRFLYEAELTSGLQHPNIIRVFEYGEDDGHPYIALELLEGESLRAVAEAGRAGDDAQRIRLARQAAEALAYIHQRKIIHRDIKPENLHIDRAGHLRLMDFGIAGVAGEAAALAGATAGTPYYMSPEQVLGQPLTQQADIYSFGVLLYELFTGIKPFNGASVNEIFEQILFRPVDPGPLTHLPEAVRSIILACTNKKLMERPASMGPVVDALVPPPRPAEPGQLSPSSSRPESTIRLKMPPPPQPGVAPQPAAIAAPKPPAKPTHPLVLAALGAIIVAAVIYLITVISAR
jgi:serine/threonine-protein kinase